MPLTVFFYRAITFITYVSKEKRKHKWTYTKIKSIFRKSKFCYLVQQKNAQESGNKEIAKTLLKTIETQSVYELWLWLHALSP